MVHNAKHLEFTTKLVVGHRHSQRIVHLSLKLYSTFTSLLWRSTSCCLTLQGWCQQPDQLQPSVEKRSLGSWQGGTRSLSFRWGQSWLGAWWKRCQAGPCTCSGSWLPVLSDLIRVSCSQNTQQPAHLRLMMVPWTVPCPDTKSVPGGKASASAHSVSIRVLQDPAGWPQCPSATVSVRCLSMLCSTLRSTCRCPAAADRPTAWCPSRKAPAPASWQAMITSAAVHTHVGPCCAMMGQRQQQHPVVQGTPWGHGQL